MVSATCPHRLVRNGRPFNHTGPGRSPGSQVFIDPGRGEVLELYFAKVTSVGPQYGLGTLANNSHLGAVRIDHGLLNGSGPLRLGMVLLVGPLAFEPPGPRAQGAWPVISRAAELQPPAVRKLGTITALKPGFGFLRPGDGSPDLFFHFTECRTFRPEVGMTVQFALGHGLRGRTAAVDLRPL